MVNKWYLLGIFVLSILFLQACGQASPSPTAVPETSPTPTARPKPTRAPTATPAPTASPTPVPTATPTLEALQRFRAEVEKGVLIVRFVYDGEPGDYPGLQVFLDVDQNFETGYTTRSVGAEYLAEIVITEDGGGAALHRYTGADQAAEWSWEKVQEIAHQLAEERVEVEWRIPVENLGDDVQAVDMVFRAVAKDWSVAYESPKYTFSLAEGQVAGPPTLELELQPGETFAEQKGEVLQFAYVPQHALTEMNAVQLYLDIDGNHENGYLTINGLGAEYYAAIGLTAQTATLYRFTGPSGSTEWQWEEVTALTWHQDGNTFILEVPLEALGQVERVDYVFREVDTNWETLSETQPNTLSLTEE